MNNDIFIDLDRKFTKLPNGNIKKTTTEETINQSIKTILSTVPGERIMLPTFGSYIKFILFEPMDETTADMIRSEIQKRISIWDDRVSISAVSVDPDYDRNMYKVYIQYTYLLSNVQFSLTTNLKSFA
jgi:phage baseplate assembly protein W